MPSPALPNMMQSLLSVFFPHIFIYYTQDFVQILIFKHTLALPAPAGGKRKELMKQYPEKFQGSIGKAGRNAHSNNMRLYQALISPPAIHNGINGNQLNFFIHIKGRAGCLIFPCPAKHGAAPALLPV